MTCAFLREGIGGENVKACSGCNGSNAKAVGLSRGDRILCLKVWFSWGWACA